MTPITCRPRGEDSPVPACLATSSSATRRPLSMRYPAQLPIPPIAFRDTASCATISAPKPCFSKSWARIAAVARPMALVRRRIGSAFRRASVLLHLVWQTSRVDEAGRERRCREAGRHLRGLSGVSDNERPIADDRSCLRRRQTGRIDAELQADLVFGKKIMLQRIMLRIVLDAGLRARQASLPSDPRKRKRPATVQHTLQIGDGRSRIRKYLIRAGSSLGIAQPQSIAGISAGSRLHQMSGHPFFRQRLRSQFFDFCAGAFDGLRRIFSTHTQKASDNPPCQTNPGCAVLV